MDSIQELRVRAEILHHRVLACEPEAIRRIRRVVGPNSADVRRQHCLTVIANELGFTSWPVMKRVLLGADSSDYGTLLCPPRCGGYLNLWYKTHDEASQIRSQRGGWLLAYRHQYFVTERYYIEALRLDPRDPAWRALSFDWTTPGASKARTELYSKLIFQLPQEGEASA